MDKNILEIAPAVVFAKSFLIERLSYMSKKGFQMHLTCPFDERIEDHARQHCYRYYALDIHRLISVASDIKVFLKLCKYIRENHIDCVVGHADKGTLMAALVGLFTRKKVITYIHGTSFETRKGISRRIFILVDWFQSLLSIKNVCVSQFLVDLRTELHIAPKRKQVVPNIGSCCGIDCKKFDPNKVSYEMKASLRKTLGINEEDFVIGFCGRFTKDKGIDKLVEAFGKLDNYVKDKFILLLLGSTDIRDRLPQHVLDLMKNCKRIVCPGHISENIENYYSIMDVFVLPTRRDGFGMCLLEAAAMGVPVLSSPLTGSRDAMSVKHNGEYIKIDSDDIAKKIQYLYDNPDLRKEYSKYGIDWAKNNFHNEIVYESICDIYSDVLK